MRNIKLSVLFFVFMMTGTTAYGDNCSSSINTSSYTNLSSTLSSVVLKVGNNIHDKMKDKTTSYQVDKLSGYNTILSKLANNSSMTAKQKDILNLLVEQFECKISSLNGGFSGTSNSVLSSNLLSIYNGLDHTSKLALCRMNGYKDVNTITSCSAPLNDENLKPWIQKKGDQYEFLNYSYNHINDYFGQTKRYVDKSVYDYFQTQYFNGTCGSTINSCSAGTYLENSANETSTQYKWKCYGYTPHLITICGIDKTSTNTTGSTGNNNGGSASCDGVFMGGYSLSDGSHGSEQHLETYAGISGGMKSAERSFVCNNGTWGYSGEENILSVTCNNGYTESNDGKSCVSASTQNTNTCKVMGTDGMSKQVRTDKTQYECISMCDDNNDSLKWSCKWGDDIIKTYTSSTQLDGRMQDIIGLYSQLFSRTVSSTDDGVLYWYNSPISITNMRSALINGAVGNDRTAVCNNGYTPDSTAGWTCD